jgi:hypothetical protein
VEPLITALLANIRLGCKWLTVTNAQAYCGTELITIVKSFKVPAPEVLFLWLTADMTILLLTSICDHCGSHDTVINHNWHTQPLFATF